MVTDGKTNGEHHLVIWLFALAFLKFSGLDTKTFLMHTGEYSEYIYILSLIGMFVCDSS